MGTAKIATYSTYNSKELLKDLAKKGLKYRWKDPANACLTRQQMTLLPTIDLLLSQCVNQFSIREDRTSIVLTVDKRELFKQIPLSTDQRKRRLASFADALDLMQYMWTCMAKEIKPCVHEITFMPSLVNELNSYENTNHHWGRLDPKQPIYVPASLYVGNNKEGGGRYTQTFITNRLLCIDHALGKLDNPIPLIGAGGLADRYLFKSYKRYREEKTNWGSQREYINSEIVGVLDTAGLFKLDVVHSSAGAIEETTIQISAQDW